MQSFVAPRQSANRQKLSANRQKKVVEKLRLDLLTFWRSKRGCVVN